MAVIYAITCIQTGKAYIGCTAGKIAKRMREHRCLLRAGRHYSPKFQSEWDRHGEQSFAITQLVFLGHNVTLDVKRKAEQKWIDQYLGKGLLLNEATVSFAPMAGAIIKGIEAARTVAGKRWTPEANRKRSEAQKGIPKGHGAKISATKKAKKLASLMS